MSSFKAKPIDFLDTSICVSVARGIISKEEWSAVWKYIVNRYDYAISPVTIGEIMAGVAKGDAQHFEENRAPLRVLYPTHRHSFLRLPGHFVMERMLRDLRRYPGGEPQDLKRMVRVVLAAPSKSALARGTVVLPESTEKRRGIDLEAQAGIILRGKAHFSERLERLRAGILLSPTPALAARGWMALLGREMTDEESSKVAVALDAAYRHEQMLHSLAKQPHYDFSRHDSDWIDGQQLFYLCDPAMHFIVGDNRIKTWTEGSNQASRIVPYRELRDLALLQKQAAAVH